MKRLVLAVAVLGLVGCAQGERQAAPPDTTAAPAAAPAPAAGDTMQMMQDTGMARDTARTR